MARKKAKLFVEGNVFGHDVGIRFAQGEPINLGQGLDHDPIARLDAKLKQGYLFRSPKADPGVLAGIWKTLVHFTSPYKVWVEYEQKDDKVELTAFALLSDKGEATMFAFSHSDFQKWSDELEKADAKERRRKPPKIRITKDGKIKARVTVETLGE